jgi:hypothetical protein
MCIACEMAYWMAVDDEPPPKKKAASAFDCDVPAEPKQPAPLAKPRKTPAKKRSGSARSKSASIDRE